MGFGTDGVSLGIGASTMDDQGGRINFKKEKLDDLLKKSEAEVVIYSRPVERTEAEYFSHLQSLYNYCLTGRSSVEVSPVEGGCDEWELDYAIVKHEGFIKMTRELKAMDQRVHYVGAMKQLAYLYKKKGDYEKAIEIFATLRDYDKKRNMDLWLKEYEYQIRELKKQLPNTQK
jgi:tetratricopeptide (TPR) repeat protein